MGYRMDKFFVKAGRIFGTRKHKLHQAIYDEALTKAMNFVRKDHSLCRARYDTSTILHIASYRAHCDQDLGLIKLLIELGADPNATDGDGSTPLFWASPHGHVNIVEALLKGGANPQWVNKRGMTPLDYLLDRNHGSDRNMIQVINLLCNYGGEILQDAIVKYEEKKKQQHERDEWIKNNAYSAPDQHALNHMNRV